METDFLVSMTREWLPDSQSQSPLTMKHTSILLPTSQSQSVFSFSWKKLYKKEKKGKVDLKEPEKGTML